LRPPKDVNIGGRRFGLFCALGASMTMAGLVLVMWAGSLALYFAEYRELPPLVAVTWKPVQLVVQFWWFILAAGVAYLLLYLPYIFCWNRRAKEIRRNSATSSLVEQVIVWPPPPYQD
jgi:hypothetical protein